jgi:hypothetical protein
MDMKVDLDPIFIRHAAESLRRMNLETRRAEIRLKASARQLSTVFPKFGHLPAFATRVLAADFDGDGVADEFKITRDAANRPRKAGIVVVNPWKIGSSKPSKELGFIIRLDHLEAPKARFM